MAASLSADCDEPLNVSTQEEAFHVQERIREALIACDFDGCEVFAIRLAVEEALVNAIKHGNSGDPSKKVRIAVQVDKDEFAIEIEDQGNGFRPEEVPDPTLPENMGCPSGRGLFLMRRFMTSVEHNERGNRVRMTLRR